MPTQKLTTEIIIAAITGFESQKTRIDTQIAELRAMLEGGRTEPAATPETPSRTRRKLSAAVRRRMGEAQQKRWAASKGEAKSLSETVKAKPKRKMSSARRKVISDATKKRWAAFHAAKKPAVTKKKAEKKATMKKSTVKSVKANEQPMPAA